ncbi:MAG: hypothetical protein Q7T71_12545, partial [Herbiconiux sp.]|nr:hypothetical protein [Herbiconiux sp.]
MTTAVPKRSTGLAIAMIVFLVLAGIGLVVELYFWVGALVSGPDDWGYALAAAAVAGLVNTPAAIVAVVLGIAGFLGRRIARPLAIAAIAVGGASLVL